MPGRKAPLAALAALTCGALIAPQGTSAATENVTGAKSKAFAAKSPTATMAKKGKRAKATTVSTAVGFASGSSVGATAECSGKSHATGGGYAVSPGRSGASGIAALTLTNLPSGPKSWTAGSHGFASGPQLPGTASGTFTSYVRCEGSALGKIAGVATGSLSLPASIGGDIVLNCAPGTHAIGGGFVGDAPNSYAIFDGPNNATDGSGFRIIVLQSRRTGPAQWTVSGYNRSDNPLGAQVPPTSNLTGYVICERDGKRRTVSEVSTLAAVGDNVRSAADATCTGKKHVVSGGFLVLPATFPGTVPVVGVDETAPIEKKGWHTGLWESPVHGLPAGSSLQTFAYCKKDAPKPKKK